MAELARALARLGDAVGHPYGVHDLRTVLTRDGLAGIARELLDAAGSRARHLLVVVDQFEELRDTEPGPFFDILASAAHGPARVLVTLRSEYIDALVEGLDLAVAAAYTVRPLGRAALRQVVEEPAQIAGITVSEELMARLVDDTGDGDALPLLAFTLAELAVGIHSGGALSLDCDTAFGGVRGTLRTQADAALAEARRLTGRTRRQVLDGLLELVTVNADHEPTRRRVDVSTLPGPVVEELDQFVPGRLLARERRDDGTVHIGVAHEQFLAAWEPLRTQVRRVWIRALQPTRAPPARRTRAASRDLVGLDG